MIGKAYSSLSLKGRGTAAQPQGEGVTYSVRGKKPETMLVNARRLRRERTEAEDRLWERVRDRRLQGFKFRSQAPIGAYVADFLCSEAKLVVELDGSQHVDEAARDKQRTGFLVSQGYRVIRFWNHDVLARMDAVCEAILEALTAPHPGARAPVPLPFRERGE